MRSDYIDCILSAVVHTPLSQCEWHIQWAQVFYIYSGMPLLYFAWVARSERLQYM